MAAGLGFKDFVTGEVLTAADVDGYLMQGVWVFASAAARDAAVTAPSEGNFAYLKDTNVTTYYTGSAWANLDTTGMTNPMTTTGDTIYSSSGSTPARLGIGSTGQVLTVASGLPSWATPAAGGGGMTLISRTSFSNVASQAFDGVFTSTYDTYFVNINSIYAATADNDLHWQFRYAGPTTQTANYYSANFGYNYNAELTNAGINNGSEILVSTQSGANDRPTSAQLYVNQVGNASQYGAVSGLVFNNPSLLQSVLGGEAFVARTYTGFLLKSSSTNITGTVSIFGVNKS
jgi:hypothetical protein